MEHGAGYEICFRRLDVSRVLSLVVEGAGAKAFFVSEFELVIFCLC